MGIVTVIGTIVFFAVVALGLLAMGDVLFSSGRRAGSKPGATTGKPSRFEAWHPAWMAKTEPRATKLANRRATRDSEVK
jgi:hypothetical protein